MYPIVDLILLSCAEIMVSMTPTSINKDYFWELHLKRQAQMAKRAELGVGSSTSVVEAIVLIIVVATPEGNRPPINSKNMKEGHGKDHGRSSRRHRECSSLGKSPKRGRVAGGRVQLTLISWVTTCKWIRRSQPYKQDAYLLARPFQVHDAFMELCLCTLVLGKRMALDLMKQDKNVVELDNLCV